MYDECHNCLLQVVILVKVIDEANPPEEMRLILQKIARAFWPLYALRMSMGTRTQTSSSTQKLARAATVYKRACKSLNGPFHGHRFSMAFRTLCHKMLLETILL